MINKRNFLYISVLLFIIEVLIALLIHDSIVRPYVGDTIVVIFLYCFIRGIVHPIHYLPLWVFLFACFVEMIQYFDLYSYFHIDNPILKIILGSTFDIHDLICYLIGMLILIAFEKIERH